MTVYAINTETEAGSQKYQQLMKVDSPLFKAVEKEFYKWLDESNPANEYEDMYFSEDAIYTVKGAVRGAIEQIFEVMEEYKIKSISLTDNRLDLRCAFE